MKSKRKRSDQYLRYDLHRGFDIRSDMFFELAAFGETHGRGLTYMKLYKILLSHASYTDKNPC